MTRSRTQNAAVHTIPPGTKAPQQTAGVEATPAATYPASRISAAAPPLPPPAILQLQRSIGNRAMQQLMRRTDPATPALAGEQLPQPVATTSAAPAALAAADTPSTNEAPAAAACCPTAELKRALLNGGVCVLLITPIWRALARLATSCRGGRTAARVSAIFCATGGCAASWRAVAFNRSSVVRNPASRSSVLPVAGVSAAGGSAGALGIPV